MINVVDGRDIFGKNAADIHIHRTSPEKTLGFPPVKPYDPDLNHDGKVDIYDIVMMAKSDPSRILEVAQHYTNIFNR